MMKASLPAFCAALSLLVPAALAKEPKKPVPKPVPVEPAAPAQAFGWPFIDWKDMTPRGGTTQGAEVTLLKGATGAWTRLQEPGLAKFEKDRRAILALAGNYRVSFDFTESYGLKPDFKPMRPYFSWGTENVTVIEDRPEFLSLQHTLVMYFKDGKGKSGPPMVMKHWREDWTWQPKELHVYDKDSSWKRVPAPAPEGRWSQAVYQVDDSPRYEAIGAWTHDGGLSAWRTDVCARPLPRREFSVRSDYNVLEGSEEVNLTPSGWVHLQSNRKVLVAKDGTRTCIGGEIGVNRYEAITAPDLAGPFNRYWEKTGGYWKDVRETWAEVMKERETFTLKDEEGGQKLFDVHFARAKEIEKAGKPDPEGDLKHARETINRFLVK
ncbi:DUF6607 family protein [Luteolibacter sp. LG18]|uniref:DUF6607 family protein n=1 Tax=Luteolibacter sp. LG18 TaxID=2819286 RepID=UPI0030C75771